VNGFYSQKLKTSDGTVYDKVRVIAVNTEACYNANFFLMKLRDDPGDQLAWLEQTLYEMDLNKLDSEFRKLLAQAGIMNWLEG
jgi:hypothetical protein